MNWNDAILILPELVLAIGGCFLLLAPFLGFKREGEAAKYLMLVLMLATAVATVYAGGVATTIDTGSPFHRMFALDGFAIFFKLLFVFVVTMVTLLSADFLREERYSPWEFYSLLAFALCGMTFMASGTHLVSIYIGLELLSLSSYILAGFYKRETKSTEAAMKYMILGAVSSGILLYGISLIFGVTGAMRLADIQAALVNAPTNDALMIGIMLLGAGLCFKIAAVPFHVWTPDVYEGAPTPVTAFLSTGSKAAAFAIFARIFYEGIASLSPDWRAMVATVAALSMVVGNLAAITQDNVKRMLAYSSIGSAGYALLGILSMSELGLFSVLIYILVYMFATLGIWATVLMLRRRAYAGEAIDDFQGLHKRAPGIALAMVIFLLSLGGIPPTAGFIGKYYLFAGAIQAGWGWLAIIAVLMSAVSMFYYFRIVVAMYLKEGVESEVAVTPQLRLTVVVCLVLTLAIGIFPEPLLRGVRDSLRGKVAGIVTVAQR